MEELLKKLGISDEDITKILSGMKEDKLFITREERIEERYSKLKQQKEDLEGQLTTASATLEDLKKSNKGSEDLQAKIKQYETDIANLKTESESKIKNLTLDNAIKLKLKESKAKYEDLLMSKFDREKLQLKEDGSIEGLDDQLTSLREGYKDLFEQPLAGRSPANNGGAKPQAGEGAWQGSTQDAKVQPWNRFNHGI
jgi:chromosome segregation ATPase